MAITMYIQVNESDGEFKTVLKLDDKPFADFIASELGGRSISQTALQRSLGMPGLKKAMEEALTNPMPEKEISKYRKKFLSIKKDQIKDYVVKIPETYHKAIKENAQETGTSMNAWINEAIRRRLEQEELI